MSQQAVEQIVGRLLLDRAFRDQVRSDRHAALAGYDLTPEELAGLDNLDLDDFHQTVSGLDERVSKGLIGN